MMQEQRKRVAVVSGGSSGIGLATVRQLLTCGHRVAFFGHNPVHVQSALDELASQFTQDNFLGLPIDILEPDAVRKFFHAVEQSFGAPEILVCSAGISPKGPNGARPVSDISTAEWNSVIGVNLTGALLCCQAVLPQMQHASFGRIVFVGSLAGRTLPKVAGGAYAASKAALAGFARSLVAGRADGVTINTVAPGRILTAMSGPAERSINQAALSRIPVGRLGTPEDVANAIGFLTSDLAGFINGAILDVNGGEFAPA